jgi:predicted RNA binding protein YcfA (HicA-like mRNA interferase family)
MPRKIRELIKDLKRAGFHNRGGKGSHRNFTDGVNNVTVSGYEGADAQYYQEKEVREAIRKARNK